MRLTLSRFVLATVAVLAVLLCAASLRAMAEEPLYPNRPLTLVVTFTAGGSSDVLARAVADAMSRGLGKQVAVDNRPGAGGHIGAESVAHAAPDGYTILFGTNGTLGIGPALYKNLRYDPGRDLAPIGMLHELPLLLIVNPSVPVTNLRQLIDYATPIQGSSLLPQPASARSRISPANSSRNRRGLISCTCPTKVAARLFRICWQDGSR